MKTSMQKIILCVSIIFPFCLTIYAEQAEQPKRQLQFVNSDEYVILDPSLKKSIGNEQPKYIAVIKFINIPLRFGGRSSGENINISMMRPVPALMDRGISINLCIIKDATSTKPLEFMYLQNSRNNEFSFLANTEQQARKYVEAFTKGLDTETDNRIKDLRNQIETYQKIIREGDTVIPKMEADYRELEEQKNKAYKEYAKANYINDEKVPEINDIEKVEEELSHSLREVDFELIGLDAKTESINKYKLSGTIIDNETLIKLNQILIATDIERAGALARMQAFDAAFKQANQLHSLILKSEKALHDLNIYKNEFKIAPEMVSSFKRELENPAGFYQYVGIEDNKVTIKPVQQD